MTLRRYVTGRVLSLLPVLVGVTAVTFGLVHLAPGDPVDAILALHPDVSPAEEARLRARYGLADPVWVRYLRWAGGVVRGDFGIVVGTRRSAGAVVAARLPATLALGLFGWTFAVCIALPTGVYAALRRGSAGDHASRLLALTGVSIPNFWLGLVLLLVGALVANWWPVLPPRKPLYHPATLWYLVLPGLTIGTASAATLMRVTRTAVAEQLRQAYVRTARAKGLPERTVVGKHVLRNALVSVTTIAAFLTASLVSGAVVVETVFDWPGLGRELVAAVRERQVNLVLAITLVTAVAVVLANLLADLCYAALDPRIRYR